MPLLLLPLPFVLIHLRRSLLLLVMMMVVVQLLPSMLQLLLLLGLLLRLLLSDALQLFVALCRALGLKARLAVLLPHAGLRIPKAEGMQ